MNKASTISRILLGTVFALAGLSGLIMLFFLSPPPAPAGLAGTFQDVFFKSHWVAFVDGVEFATGVLLLANRYVPLALTALAGVISNIIVFHVTMMPAGLPVALFVLVLWTVTALPLRSHFAPLFVARAAPSEERAPVSSSRLEPIGA